MQFLFATCIFPKMHPIYTRQLSRLKRESHACGLKTSISRPLTLAGQFLRPDWKMWVVAVLLDTISKNMLSQTHVRTIFEVKSTGSELAFIRVLRLGLHNSPFGRLLTSSEDFGRLRKSSDFFRRLWTSSGIFGNDRVVFKNPTTPRIKISRLYLRKSWQVYLFAPQNFA